MRHRLLYIVASIVTGLAVWGWSSSFPKEYASQAKIIDEKAETDILVGLNNLAAAAKLSKAATTDASKSPFYPTVYVQILDSEDFAEEMSSVYIPSQHTDYKHYLLERQKEPWWKGLWSDTTHGDAQDAHKWVLRMISDHIHYQVVSLSRMIIIEVVEQDPLVAAELADSVTAHLQHRLIQIRRQRLYDEYEHSGERLAQAEAHYLAAQEAYTRFADSHRHASNKLVETLSDEYENDKEQANLSYRSAKLQHQRSEAYLNRSFNDFTIIEHPWVPQHAISPQPFVNVLMAESIVLIIITWFILLRYRLRVKKTGISAT